MVCDLGCHAYESTKIRLNFKNQSFSKYRISANSFRGNYSFLDLTLCTVTFDLSTYRCGNYSRAETIRGNRSYQKMSKRKVVFNLMFIKKIL